MNDTEEVPYKFFQGCESNITETSKDDQNKQVLIHSNITVYDFDKVKDQYCNSYKQSQESFFLCSADAFHSYEADTYLLIEFKNGKIDSKVRKNIKQKISDSLIMLMDIMSINLEYVRKHFDFILVYNEEKNQEEHLRHKEIKSNTIRKLQAEQALKSKLLGLGGEEIIKFKLGGFKRLFFRDVHTYNEEQFDSKMLS